MTVNAVVMLTLIAVNSPAGTFEAHNRFEARPCSQLAGHLQWTPRGPRSTSLCYELSFKHLSCTCPCASSEAEAMSSLASELWLAEVLSEMLSSRFTVPSSSHNYRPNEAKVTSTRLQASARDGRTRSCVASSILVCMTPLPLNCVPQPVVHVQLSRPEARRASLPHTP